MALLEVRNLQVNYGPIQAVKGIDLDVEKGTLVALLGANGAGKTTTGNLVTTNYGTAVDNYSASGPYKLTSFEPDKSFTLERNENWYGWTDGKHEGQYMTTKVTYTIVTEHATEVMLFKQGALDEIQLTSDDMEEFRASDNLLKTYRRQPSLGTYAYGQCR